MGVKLMELGIMQVQVVVMSANMGCSHCRQRVTKVVTKMNGKDPIDLLPFFSKISAKTPDMCRQRRHVDFANSILSTKIVVTYAGRFIVIGELVLMRFGLFVLICLI
jgi:copper chaperone CopZ